uniref:Uncharacterized protein n=1 Tax=Nothoprocta perdicaria TaxID=30464 RepID=A0A8C6YMK9_NOTPE
IISSPPPRRGSPCSLAPSHCFTSVFLSLESGCLLRSRLEVTTLLVSSQESNQGLTMPKLCRSSKWVEWLPRGNMAELLVPSTLQELHGAMEHMDHALQTISQHQRDLNAPGSELLRRLANTHLKVRGLLNNIETLLRAQGIVPIHISLPQKPAVTKVFQQKLEGCKVLWSYSRFMSKLNTSLEAKGLLDFRKPPSAAAWVEKRLKANKRVRPAESLVPRRAPRRCSRPAAAPR